MENTTQQFITYGISVTKEKFTEAYNGSGKGINKPNGGLWASPVDSTYGWRDWCLSEDFRLNTFSCYTKFQLCKDSKVCIVDSLLDLKKLYEKYPLIDPTYPSWVKVLDWDKLKQDYDALWLTAKGDSECHWVTDGGPDMYTWDCESIVIFRWSAINESSIETEGKGK